ncbi:MAG: TrbI/VirB10 family protein [Pseudomonadota bacterium]
MTEQAASPEPLAIRNRPDPVKRFSKPALALLMGTGAAVVLGAFALAFAPGRDGDQTPRELYSTRNKTTADGLSSMPSTYADMKPDLGPPLQGDLGTTVLAARERAARDPLAEAPSRTDAALEEAELEALLRSARLAETARTSGVFFTVERGRPEDAFGAIGEPVREARRAYDGFADLAERAGSGFSSAHDPGGQAGKQAFASAEIEPSIYNPFRVQEPVASAQLMAGSVIPASLITAINSDLPGQVIAQVTENVYDTVTGQMLLIPQGARVIGRYDSVIAFGQSRALLIWTRIIMPDGSSIQVDNLPGVDGRGQAGLADRTDHHGWRLAQGIALSTLLGVSAELASDDDNEIARAIQNSAQDGINRAGQRIVERQLSVQPTLTIRQGWRFSIIADQDLILRPYKGG